jgi:hypothetical protein
VQSVVPPAAHYGRPDSVEPDRRERGWGFFGLGRGEDQPDFLLKRAPFRRALSRSAATSVSVLPEPV